MRKQLFFALVVCMSVLSFHQAAKACSANEDNTGTFAQDTQLIEPTQVASNASTGTTTPKTLTVRANAVH